MKAVVRGVRHTQSGFPSKWLEHYFFVNMSITTVCEMEDLKIIDNKSNHFDFF